jgi:PAS domain S-box-containing protein
MKTAEIQFSPKLIGDLLNIIHNAILVIDGQQQIIFANSRTAKMFNTTISSLQNIKITQLFMADDEEIMVPNILDIIKKEKEFEGEAMLQRFDGSTFLGMIAGTFFCWDDNKEGMAFTIHDITNMKSLELSLKRSERNAFLGRLVDDISHQIRNPVMVIGGCARRLDAGAGNSPKLQAIIKEASRLENLLDTLNNFIRLPGPNPVPVKMKKFIKLVEERLQQIISDTDCEFISEYQDGISDQILLVDQELLLPAIEAVAINACESYRAGEIEKKVILRIKCVNDHFRPYLIQVIDYGVGIPPENIEHIFSHFYSNKTTHIGMGLTFVQRIIEEQLGSISIDSVLDQGTTVSLRLIRERRRKIRTTRSVL